MPDDILEKKASWRVKRLQWGALPFETGNIFIRLVCGEERKTSMYWCLGLESDPLGWVQAGQGEVEAN